MLALASSMPAALAIAARIHRGGRRRRRRPLQGAAVATGPRRQATGAALARKTASARLAGAGGADLVPAWPGRARRLQARRWVSALRRRWPARCRPRRRSLHGSTAAAGSGADLVPAWPGRARRLQATCWVSALRWRWPARCRPRRRSLRGSTAAAAAGVADQLQATTAARGQAAHVASVALTQRAALALASSMPPAPAIAARIYRGGRAAGGADQLLATIEAAATSRASAAGAALALARSPGQPADWIADDSAKTALRRLIYV
ncbi:hypothetical protein QE400_000095 [Xanthomonas sacchari]|uniref:hypothetical protein n=1 Tax=Xanthomonas sacchari TaxID=56458 RepID=UPI0027840814|nr:hypothetical protein [Xanthomonas sacchari]MDQ1090682.1 hypothetical protein [Xanthomonas sacchari]